MNFCFCCMEKYSVKILQYIFCVQQNNQSHTSLYCHMGENYNFPTAQSLTGLIVIVPITFLAYHNCVYASTSDILVKNQVENSNTSVIILQYILLQYIMALTEERVSSSNKFDKVNKVTRLLPLLSRE